CHQRRIILQLGEPADAVARRALEIGNLTGIEIAACINTEWMEPCMSNIDRRTLVKGSLAAMMAGAAFSRAAFAQSSEPVLLGVDGGLANVSARRPRAIRLHQFASRLHQGR